MRGCEFKQDRDRDKRPNIPARDSLSRRSGSECSSSAEVLADQYVARRVLCWMCQLSSVELSFSQQLGRSGREHRPPTQLAPTLHRSLTVNAVGGRSVAANFSVSSIAPTRTGVRLQGPLNSQEPLPHPVRGSVPAAPLVQQHRASNLS
jgi:hypothetical protein